MYRITEINLLPSDGIEEVYRGEVQESGDLNISENFLEFAIDFISLGMIEEDDAVSIEVVQTPDNNYNIKVQLSEGVERNFIVKKA